MKKSKGFMLAEVVVTSTIVMTTLISLYVTFNKLYTNYKVRTRYFDIDGVYAIKAMIDTMLDTGELKSQIPTSSNYIQINCDNIPQSKNSCKSINETYNITNMYIVKKESLSSLQTESNQTLKDYITYMQKYYNINDTNYNYFIIVEYKNNNDFYYSSLMLG